MSTKSAVPEKLYKYLPKSENSLQNLRNRRIYFPTPSELNDPFDCNVPVNIVDSTSEDLKKVYQMLYNKMDNSEVVSNQYLSNGLPNENFQKYIHNFAEKVELIKRKYFNEIGVACFSESLSSIPDNILMWSHYANGHKGFCLEFDTSYFPFTGLPIPMQEVKYKADYPSLRSGQAIKGGEVWVEPLINKSKEWTYEQEWRLVVGKGATFGFYDPKALTAIYFGCLMQSDEKEEILEILNGYPTKFYEMRRSVTTYTLEAEEYNPSK